MQFGTTFELQETVDHDMPRLTLLYQRNLNNAFAYDLVPSPSVITAALKAARRVNDFPTAVRIFEGISPTIASILATCIF
jgi:hypothetical protein